MLDADAVFHAGHRARLKEKLQDDKLTSYEKLELLLTYAIPRRDVRPLARSLIQKFRSVYGVFTASIDDLKSVSGVGYNTALLIHLVHELMLVSHREILTDSKILSQPDVLKEYCRQLLSGKNIEEFHVLYMGAEGRLITDEIHSHGTIDSTHVYPREIAKSAVRLNARSVILVHNHPMSDNDFSSDDIALTTDVEQMLRHFEIVLHDHLLVTSHGTVFSMREQPWLNLSLFCK